MIEDYAILSKHYIGFPDNDLRFNCQVQQRVNI